MTFDVVGAAVSSPMDFRGDEEFILPEFIRIDQSGIGQFIGNLTQRFIGTRSSTSYSALAVTCGAVISLEMEMILLMRVVVDISSNLAMPLIPTPSLIYSEIVRFNSGI